MTNVARMRLSSAGDEAVMARNALIIRAPPSSMIASASAVLDSKW